MRDVTVHARQLQTHQRHQRLERSVVTRIPLGRERAPERSLGSGPVAALKGQCGQCQRQLGVATLRRPWQRTCQRRDRLDAAVKNHRHAARGDDPRGERPDPALDGVSQRAHLIAAEGVHACRARMQPRDLAGQFQPQACPQELGEHAVIAVPAPLIVDRAGRDARPLKPLQHPAAIVAPAQRLGQRRIERVHDGRAQQELAQLDRLAGQHLRHEVVAHRCVLACELVDELRRRRVRAQRCRRQPQPRRPALGVHPQTADALTARARASAESLEQRAGLADRARQAPPRADRSPRRPSEAAPAAGEDRPGRPGPASNAPQGDAAAARSPARPRSPPHGSRRARAPPAGHRRPAHSPALERRSRPELEREPRATPPDR